MRRLTFNRKLPLVKESQTLALSRQANTLASQGVDVINLTAGELDFKPPRAAQRAVVRSLNNNKYTPVAGEYDLRVLLARAESKNRPVQFSPEQVVVTAGAKQALAVCFQTILNNGDEVIIPIPSWASYESQVLLAGGKPVFVPLKKGTFDLDVAAIRKKLNKRTRAIVFNSPHNPTGAIFSATALKALAKAVRGKDIWIITDDIYRALAFARSIPHILRYIQEQVIVVNGFSKSHALTGWRIGYIAAPLPCALAIVAIMSHTSGNTSALSQAAGHQAVQSSTPVSYMRALARRKSIVAALLMQDQRLSFQEPRGGFYFFIDLSAITRDTASLCATLLHERGLALVPGEAFHAPGYVRLSYAASDHDVREGVWRFLKYMQTL